MVAFPCILAVVLVMQGLLCAGLFWGEIEAASWLRLRICPLNAAVNQFFRSD